MNSHRTEKSRALAIGTLSVVISLLVWWLSSAVVRHDAAARLAVLP